MCYASRNLFFDLNIQAKHKTYSLVVQTIQYVVLVCDKERNIAQLSSVRASTFPSSVLVEDSFHFIENTSIRKVVSNTGRLALKLHNWRSIRSMLLSDSSLDNEHKVVQTSKRPQQCPSNRFHSSTWHIVPNTSQWHPQVSTPARVLPWTWLEQEFLDDLRICEMSTLY